MPVSLSLVLLGKSRTVDTEDAVVSVVVESSESAGEPPRTVDTEDVVPVAVESSESAGEPSRSIPSVLQLLMA